MARSLFRAVRYSPASSRMPFDLPASGHKPSTQSHSTTSSAPPRRTDGFPSGIRHCKQRDDDHQMSWPADCDSRYWFIDGAAYDLSSFDHPGGEHMMLLGKGRDCTTLFNTCDAALLNCFSRYGIHISFPPTPATISSIKGTVLFCKSFSCPHPLLTPSFTLLFFELHCPILSWQICIKW
jgi:hypothetical protein